MVCSSLMDTIDQCGLHRRTCMKGAEDGDGFNRRQRQRSRNVGCNPGQPQDLYAQSLAGFLHRLEVGAAELLKSQHQRLAAHGLSYHFSMRPKMIPDRGANEVRAVGIETSWTRRSIWPRSMRPRLIVIFSVSDAFAIVNAIVARSSWIPYGSILPSIRMVKSVGQGECLDRTNFIGRAAGRRGRPECEFVAEPLPRS